MMTEIYDAFKGTSSVPPTPLALTLVPATAEGENVATEEVPPNNTSQPEGEEMVQEPEKESSSTPAIQATPISSAQPEKPNKGKSIITDESQLGPVGPGSKLNPASKEVQPDPSLVPFEINGVIHYLTEAEYNAYLDQEEQRRKQEEMEKNRIALINILKEEAPNAGINPKDITTDQAGAKFKQIQHVEHEALKKKHEKKLKDKADLKQRRIDPYNWAMTSRLKPEPILTLQLFLIQNQWRSQSQEGMEE